MKELPGAFLKRIKQSMPAMEYEAFVDSLELPPVNSLRYNPRKPIVGISGTTPVPWCSQGFYLSEKPLYTLDPLFHAGCYYPQEASSMILNAILNQISARSGKDLKVLDLCGAPGGKSTLIASFLNGKGFLVSNEVIASRARILQENMIKWGAPNIMVTRSQPSEFASLPGFFDVMVVDAPCSGEGMFRKGETARSEWSLENAMMCSGRQRRILMEAWDALKEDGWLIYSTCTFNPAENQENLQWLASQKKMEIADLSFPEAWGLQPIPILDGKAHAFYPHKTRGEGFFVALIQKKESHPNQKMPSLRKIKHAKRPEIIGKIFPDEAAWHFIEKPMGWCAIPDGYQQYFQLVGERLNLLYSGIMLGTQGRKEWLPNHALAMSWIGQKAFPHIELMLEEALKYLKGETLMPHAGMERGFYSVTFNGHSLGFVKNVGNRLNNLYPKEWRIRMNI